VAGVQGMGQLHSGCSAGCGHVHCMHSLAVQPAAVAATADALVHSTLQGWKVPNLRGPSNEATSWKPQHC
jgi:hypothetical protein